MVEIKPEVNSKGKAGDYEEEANASVEPGWRREKIRYTCDLR
jgi:hypothetical protein